MKQREPVKEWWRRLFDTSYPVVYAYTEKTVEEEVEQLWQILALEPGMRLLDVCCGFGRHSIPLAERGLRVTGVDYSRAQLAEARRRARAAGVRVEWVRADAREFRTARKYARVINMFTSFGYFETDEEDALMLARMAAALKPGGLLLLDTLNRDWIARHFAPAIAMELNGGHVITNNQIDHVRGRIVSRRLLCLKGKTRENFFSIRLYTVPELARMASACGLELVEVLGGLDRQPLGIDSKRIVLVARKIS